MSIDPLLHHRLASLRLVGPPLDTAADAVVRLSCFAELSEAQRMALGAVVEHFGEFLGLPVRMEGR